MNWYRKAADEGNSEAMHNIASLYEKGLGVPKDEDEARKWYRKAEGGAETDKTPAK
jgi:TPR repeat protein